MIHNCAGEGYMFHHPVKFICESTPLIYFVFTIFKGKKLTRVNFETDFSDCTYDLSLSSADVLAVPRLNGCKVYRFKVTREPTRKSSKSQKNP